MRKTIDRNDFLDEYESWVTDPRIRYARLEEPSSDLLNLMRVPLTFEARVRIAPKMARIGPFYLTEGAVRCFRDATEGWKLMKRGLLYCHWDDRIAARARDFWNMPMEERRPFKSAEYLANVAALGLSIARSEAIWTLETMERVLVEGNVGWDGRDFFAAYLLRLYRKLNRKEDIKQIPPDAENWDQPFNDLVDRWEDEVELARAIKRMCDYHLRWNYEDIDEHDSEFSSPYAMINPIELHALRAVREELGLAMPEVEHELLQPPLYPVPEFAKSITTEEILQEDELLRQIVERNQPWCDGVEK